MYSIGNNIRNMKSDLRHLSESVDEIEKQIGIQSIGNVRAFSSPDIEFYSLIFSIGCLPVGTVFYYDPNDSIHGSISEGCLKLAWTQEGNCQGGICGDSVIFHAKFRKDHTVFRRLYARGDIK